METCFCPVRDVPQQRLICQALLYPNSAGNTPAFRSFQKAPQIPATHPLTQTGAKTNLSSDGGCHPGGLSFPAAGPTSTSLIAIRQESLRSLTVHVAKQREKKC